MSTDSGPTNIREFMKLILKTEIHEAKQWVMKFVLPIPAWDSYARMSVTEESVECIAEGISAQISLQITSIFGSGNPYAEVVDRGHAFLQEIYQKATALGLTPDLAKIDFILEPKMPPTA